MRASDKYTFWSHLSRDGGPLLYVWRAPDSRLDHWGLSFDSDETAEELTRHGAYQFGNAQFVGQVLGRMGTEL